MPVAPDGNAAPAVIERSNLPGSGLICHFTAGAGLFLKDCTSPAVSCSQDDRGNKKFIPVNHEILELLLINGRPGDRAGISCLIANLFLRTPGRLPLRHGRLEERS